MFVSYPMIIMKIRNFLMYENMAPEIDGSNPPLA